jgi:hypothetical protein
MDESPLHTAPQSSPLASGGPILLTNALVPLRRGGLQSSLVWTLGLDLNF